MDKNITSELALQYLNKAFDFSIRTPNDFARAYLAVVTDINKEFNKNDYSDVNKPLPTYSDVEEFFKK